MRLMIPKFVRLPEAEWPKMPPAKVHSSREEAMKLFTKWGVVGALELFDARDITWSEAVGWFPVFKDQDRDRLILNPTVVNSRCRSFSDQTRKLGQGFLMTRIILQPGQWAELSADDM